MGKFKTANEIRVGVIGYGGAFNMGRAHLLQMQQAGMTPVAVAEIDPERLKAAETDFSGIQTYLSVADMLKESNVNLVTIITPHNTHAKLALQCLRAGKHVVCEKPLAITTAECDAMIKEATKQGVVLSTYHNRHWDGCILKAVELIVKKGVIGDIVRIEAHMGGWRKPGDWWRTSKSISGGVLYDWGVHLLEYSLQLLKNAEMAEVSAYAKSGVWGPETAWKDDANEDEAFAVTRFKSGQWLTLTISNLDSNPKPGILEITGTKGTYVMDHSTWKTVTHEKDGAVTTRTGQNPASEGQKFYQNIADHLVKDAALIITPEWSRRPIHILDLANQSVLKGKAAATKYA